MRKLLQILELLMAGVILAQGALAATLMVDPGDYGMMLTGAKLTLYEVGAVGEDGIQLSQSFENSGISLTEENLPYGAELLERYAIESAISGEDQWVEKNGTVRFDDLDPGIYLVAQPQNTPDDLSIIPFLVWIRESDEEVTAYPKVTAPTITVPEPTLPQTGLLLWPVAVLFVVGVLLIVCGLVTMNERMRKEDK